MKHDDVQEIKNKEVCLAQADETALIGNIARSVSSYSIRDHLKAILNNQVPNEWISVKDQMPPTGLMVIAKNSMIEAKSWCALSQESGKAVWFHEKWDHADDFVTHWKYYITGMEQGKYETQEI